METNYEALLRALVNSMEEIYQEGRLSTYLYESGKGKDAWLQSASYQFYKVLEEKIKEGD